jgi:hypothetical protein
VAGAVLLTVSAAASRPMVSGKCSLDLPEDWVVSADGAASPDSRVQVQVSDVPFGNLVVLGQQQFPGAELHGDQSVPWVVNPMPDGGMMVVAVTSAQAKPACRAMFTTAPDRAADAETILKTLRRR